MVKTLKGHEKIGWLVFEEGTNDVCRGGGSMFGDFIYLVKIAKKRTKLISVISILARVDKSQAISSRNLSLTMRLEKMYMEIKVT